MVDGPYELGCDLFDAGDFDGAREKWTEAAALQDPDAIFNLAILSFRLNDSVGAEEWLRKGAELNHARSQYQLGLRLESQGRSGEAISWIEKSAQAEFPPAMMFLGVFHARANEFDLAEHWWLKAAQADDVEAMALLGLQYLESNRSSEGLSWLERAADAGDGDACFHLGKLALDQQRFSEAEEWLEKALDHGKDEDEVESLLQVIAEIDIQDEGDFTEAKESLMARILDPSTQEDELTELIQQAIDDEELAFEIVSDPATPEAILTLLVSSGMGNGLLLNTSASSTVLKLYYEVSGDDVEVMLGMTSNDNADDELLSWLIGDFLADGIWGSDVILRVFAHPNAGIRCLEKFLCSPWWTSDPLELPEFAMPQSLEPETTLHIFAERTDEPGLRCFAALHPLTRREDLIQLAHDLHPRVRLAITRNPMADVEVKAKAASQP